MAKGLVNEQKDLTHEEKFKLIQEACKASNAHDFILQQPQVSIKEIDTVLSFNNSIGL